VRATRINIAEIEYRIGNTARALELLSAITAETRNSRSVRDYVPAFASIAFNNSAEYKIVLHDVAGARLDAREALRFARGIFRLQTLYAIENLATVAALDGDARRAARLRGYVDASFRSGGNERAPFEMRSCEILMTALRERLSDAEIEMFAAEGSQLSEDDAVAEAIAP